VQQLEHRVECCSAENIDRLGLGPRRGLAWQVPLATPTCVNTATHYYLIIIIIIIITSITSE